VGVLQRAVLTRFTQLNSVLRQGEESCQHLVSETLPFILKSPILKITRLKVVLSLNAILDLEMVNPGLAKFRTNQKVPIRSRGLERAGTERSNRS
jgi:hypothetical protein